MDNFTRAYIECALWSSTDDDGEPLDSVYSIDDLSKGALENMQIDCADFQSSFGAQYRVAGLSDEQAGHDFWLTRNRHGAGFWDRGIGDSGEALTDAAHAYGSVDLYVGDDGLIYIA